jgi:ATP-dependent helicase HrpA
MVLETCFEVTKLAVQIATNVREASKAISDCKQFELLSVLTSEKEHIDQLLVPNFVSRMGLERLNRLPIYLQAIRQRVEKLQADPQRDRVSAADLDQALAIYAFAGGLLPLPADLSQLAAAAKPKLLEKLVLTRWLLEEFRVSLFAQALKTTEPVSVQRIKKALTL